MEVLVFVAVVGGALLAFGALWLHRRRRALTEGAGWDEPWVPETPQPDVAEDLPKVVLDRDFLLQRPRTFDPDAWDDSPDHSPGERASDWAGATPRTEATDATAPPVVDRDFLESLRRRRESALDEEWPD